MTEEKKRLSGHVDEDAKWHCDVIQALYESIWKRIADRRAAEWRASFALWSALAGVVLLSLQYRISPKPGWVVGHAAGAIFLLHGWCLRGMLRRYWVDRGMAVTCENELLKTAKVKLPKKLRQERRKLTMEGLSTTTPRQFPCGLGWWVGSQLVVTALLCVVAALVLAGVIRAGPQPARSATPEAFQGGHVAARLPDSTCFREWETRDGSCWLHRPADVVLKGSRERRP